jgi:Flp pilus assembly protein TadB
VSKERARRRAEREREAAIRRAARAAELERRERTAARRQVVRRAGQRLGLARSRVGRPSSTLTRRRRRQHQVTLLILLVGVVLAFVVRPDWPSRLAALVVAALAYPVLRTLLFRRT